MTTSSNDRSPFDTEFREVWSQAPGVKAGFWGWAIAAKPDQTSDRVAHAFRRKQDSQRKAMDVAVCGYKFPGSVKLPHTKDSICALCAARVRELESVLAT